MTREELINEFGKRIHKWLDKKSTGMLSVEIHARQGGIGDVDFFVKDKFLPKNTTRNR